MTRQKEPGTCYQLPNLGPEDYACWRNSEIGAITEALERQLMLELIGEVSGKSVLDVGCGDGDLALELSKRGAQVTGIDAAEAMIKAARRRAMDQGEKVAFEVAAVQELPFQAEQFDIVVAMTILCFVEDAAPVFKEIARVLRPDGKLVIGELGKWSTWAATRRMRGWLGSPLWRKGRFRTPRGLATLARSAGLVPAPARGAIYYPRLGLAARLMSKFDTRLGRITTFGAAFVALSTTKAGGSSCEATMSSTHSFVR